MPDSDTERLLNGFVQAMREVRDELRTLERLIAKNTQDLLEAIGRQTAVQVQLAAFGSLPETHRQAVVSLHERCERYWAAYERLKRGPITLNDQELNAQERDIDAADGRLAEAARRISDLQGALAAKEPEGGFAGRMPYAQWVLMTREEIAKLQQATEVLERQKAAGRAYYARLLQAKEEFYREFQAFDLLKEERAAIAATLETLPRDAGIETYLTLFQTRLPSDEKPGYRPPSLQSIAH